MYLTICFLLPHMPGGSHPCLLGLQSVVDLTRYRTPCYHLQSCTRLSNFNCTQFNTHKIVLHQWAHFNCCTRQTNSINCHRCPFLDCSLFQTDNGCTKNATGNLNSINSPPMLLIQHIPRSLSVLSFKEDPLRRKHRTQPGHKDTEDFACWCDSHRREETKAQRGSIGNFPKRGESLCCKCLVFNMLMNSDVLELFALEKGGNLKNPRT